LTNGGKMCFFSFQCLKMFIGLAKKYRSVIPFT